MQKLEKKKNILYYYKNSCYIDSVLVVLFSGTGKDIFSLRTKNCTEKTSSKADEKQQNIKQSFPNFPYSSCLSTENKNDIIKELYYIRENIQLKHSQLLGKSKLTSKKLRELMKSSWDQGSPADFLIYIYDLLDLNVLNIRSKILKRAQKSSRQFSKNVTDNCYQSLPIMILDPFDVKHQSNLSNFISRTTSNEINNRQNFIYDEISKNKSISYYERFTLVFDTEILCFNLTRLSLCNDNNIDLKYVFPDETIRINTTKLSNSNTITLHLIGIVIHSGEKVKSGHYSSLVKYHRTNTTTATNNNTNSQYGWWYYDDMKPDLEFVGQRHSDMINHRSNPCCLGELYFYSVI